MKGSCRRLFLLSPALALGMMTDMVVICVNWSMTCWSTGECWGCIEGCIVVFDYMLGSKASVLVEVLETSCAEAMDALAHWAGQMKPDNLRSPLQLMCVFKKLNLS